MRRLLSMLLLVVFAVPMAAPLFGVETAAETVRACCRRGGAHHCMGMGMGMPAAAGEGAVLHVAERPCPFGCVMGQTTHGAVGLAAPTAEVVGQAPEVQVAAAAECARRVARDRARGMRGPPAGTGVRFAA